MLKLSLQLFALTLVLNAPKLLLLSSCTAVQDPPIEDGGFPPATCEEAAANITALQCEGFENALGVCQTHETEHIAWPRGCVAVASSCAEMERCFR